MGRRRTRVSNARRSSAQHPQRGTERKALQAVEESDETNHSYRMGKLRFQLQLNYCIRLSAEPSSLSAVPTFYISRIGKFRDHWLVTQYEWKW